ncbi:hypothetical protein ES705_38810 [subsurface metagenome]
MVQDSMRFEIDWTLDQVQFRASIRKMIKQARASGKVLTLPLFPLTGDGALELITIITSQVRCGGCDALCCKSNPHGSDLSLLPSEYRRLKEKYGDAHLQATGEEYWIKMPCGFLQGGQCTIYPDRPLACFLYPFNPGGEGEGGRMAIALESRCPEARRITRDFYMTSWRLRKLYTSLGNEDFVKILAGELEKVMPSMQGGEKDA